MKTLVNFGRERCGACMRLDAYLKNEHSNISVEEGHVNDVGNYGIQVQGAPVLAIVKDGQIEDFTVGFNPSAVAELIKQFNK